MAKVTAKILNRSLRECLSGMAPGSTSQDLRDAAFQMSELPLEELERLAGFINAFMVGKHPADMSESEFNEYLGAAS